MAFLCDQLFIIVWAIVVVTGWAYCIVSENDVNRVTTYDKHAGMEKRPDCWLLLFPLEDWLAMIQRHLVAYL